MDKDKFDELIAMVCQTDMTYEEMAFQMHWSQQYLKKRFKELTSLSIKEYRDKYTIFNDPKFQVSHEAMDEILSGISRILDEHLNYTCFVDRKFNLVVQKGEAPKYFGFDGMGDASRYVGFIVDKHDFISSTDYYLHRHHGVMELVAPIRYNDDCIVGYLIAGVFKDNRSKPSKSIISSLAEAHNVSSREIEAAYAALPDFTELYFKNFVLLAVSGAVNQDIVSRLDSDDPFNYLALYKKLQTL